jgi:hypothetical protein
MFVLNNRRLLKLLIRINFWKYTSYIANWILFWICTTTYPFHSWKCFNCIWRVFSFECIVNGWLLRLLQRNQSFINKRCLSDIKYLLIFILRLFCIAFYFLYYFNRGSDSLKLVYCLLLISCRRFFLILIITRFHTYLRTILPKLRHLLMFL